MYFINPTMKFLFCILSVLSVVESHSLLNLMINEWNDFKATYGKNYNEVEDEIRMQIYWENRLKIVEHNILYDQGKTTYYLGVNEFTDWLPKEYQTHLLTTSARYDDSQRQGSEYLTLSNVHIPASIDWRKYGYVTPVKNQKNCGSCWAFAAVAALEGQHFKKTGNLVSLSEENLVDCSRNEGNKGCEGGWVDKAYDYIIMNHGVDTEESYPYDMKTSECRFKKGSVGATVTGYMNVPPDNETLLAQVVATIGPIAVSIDASNTDFLHYKGGVFYYKYCNSTVTDHAVTIVGYGTDPRGGDYWLVKNSWGQGWGERGYIRMSRNKDNNCGIATSPTYPLV